ncbi:baculoviral IAP repeat-containing protein 7-B-like [Aphis craccivora]|uniref:Baculoviral IAP repeat-containing protein 7-B-like n=1 Tax=Aphis craccivora TaxID=307492 RepID=A0A6G0Y8I8_APHCR|nr:baculoviral IAP repeat-containing protein 7-B-like [Aphis craccivora]
MLCKICYKEEIEIAIVPYGHAIACIECALSFDYCSMCRVSYSRLMRIHLFMNKENDEMIISNYNCAVQKCLQAMN